MERVALLRRPLHIILTRDVRFQIAQHQGRSQQNFTLHFRLWLEFQRRKRGRRRRIAATASLRIEVSFTRRLVAASQVVADRWRHLTRSNHRLLVLINILLSINFERKMQIHLLRYQPVLFPKMSSWFCIFFSSDPPTMPIPLESSTICQDSFQFKGFFKIFHVWRLYNSLNTSLIIKTQ